MRSHFDYRDRKAGPGEERCMFCGVEAPITEDSARANALNWDEYSRDVEGYAMYRTCCMAIKKFGKKLDFQYTSHRTGNPYRPGRSFHHQPVREGKVTRNSRYFWYPDLEAEALAHGWKPRGKQKESVPWTRKDVIMDLVPFSGGKKKRSKPVVTPDRKKRHNV